MSILFILIPIALGLVIVIVIAFLRAVHSGQYDDLETPAYRILIDDSKQGENNEYQPK